MVDDEVQRLLDDGSADRDFAVVRVAAILARRVQAAAAPAAGMLAPLNDIPAEAQTDAIDAEEAVAVARATLVIATADADLAPLLHAAIVEYRESRLQLGTGVLEVGLVLTLAMFVAKLRIMRDPGGDWVIEHEPMQDATIVAVADAIKEVAKATSKILGVISASG